MKKTMVVSLAIFILTSAVGIFFFIQVLSRPDIPLLEEIEPFTLEDTEEGYYDSNNKKVKLVAFFYTNCPDICPLTMMDFSKLQDKLKKEGLFGSKVELVGVTLDPEVDTKEVLKKYAEGFNADTSGWKFLRGSEAEIRSIADTYHMNFQKVSGGYIAHNTTMFLVDGKNQIRALYDMANPKKAVEVDEILVSIKVLADE